MRDRDMMPIRRRRGGIAPYDLFNDFMNMNWMDEFFNDDFFPSFSNSVRTDIKENDNEYVMEAELPGFDKKDIEIELVDDRLVIKAKHDDDSIDEGENYLRRERVFGEFCRSFSLRDIKNEEVTAEYTNGILKVVLPKTDESKSRSRKIDIQ